MPNPTGRPALLPLALAAAAAALAAAACGGGGSPLVPRVEVETPVPSPAEGAPSPTAVFPTTPAATPATPTAEPTGGPRAPLSLADRVTLYGADPGDSATGLAVGDFNGDGALDVALSAPFADGPANARPDAGEAYIFFGPFSPGESRDAAQGQQDVTVYGAAAGDQMGRAVAAADLNGDGLDDLVLGTPFADGPDGSRPDAGGVAVLLGRPAWPQTVDLAEEAPDTLIHGADEGDLAGFALATLDADGDGLDDLLIGAFWADGPDNDRPQAGEAHLLFGSPSWLDAIDLARPPAGSVTVYGAAPDDRLSEYLAGGDISGDGIDDLILPAPFAPGPGGERPRAGRVYVIFGGRLDPAYDLALGGQDLTVLGTDGGDQVGHSAAAADVDGDGAADLLLGAVSADGPGNTLNLAGEAYLLPGGRALPPGIDTREGGAALTVYGAEPVDRMGRSVAAGDLNGDGLADLILAATGGDGAQGTREDAGELYIILGRPGLEGVVEKPRRAADLVLEGMDRGDILGHSSFGRPALIVADMDGDGRAELLASALGDGPANERADAGEAYVLFFQAGTR